MRGGEEERRHFRGPRVGWWRVMVFIVVVCGWRMGWRVGWWDGVDVRM